MDVRLDEAGRDQAAVEPFLRRIGADVWSHVGDPAIPDGDVDHRVLASGDARVAQDEIERHRYCAACAWPR